MHNNHELGPNHWTVIATESSDNGGHREIIGGGGGGGLPSGDMLFAGDRRGYGGHGLMGVFGSLLARSMPFG